MTQTQSLARQQSQEMAKPTKELTLQDVAELTGYELPQIAMIRHNMATSTKTPPDKVPLYDIALFCHAARELELDPLLRQCYWITRQGKGTLQVGIDGYRAIAERSGVYAGSQPPEFRDWQEIVDGNRKILVPGIARVTVWKIIAGRSCAFTGEAYWDEWYPGGSEGFMYRKMPRHMLAKDAEAQALRKAFPAMLSKVEYAAAIGSETGDVGAPVIDVQARPRQAPPQPTPAMYDRTIGAADWGESPPTREASPAVSDEASADSSPPADALVTSKTDPLWKAWLEAEKTARAAGVEIPSEDMHLGAITAEALEASTRMVLDMVAEAKELSQAEFAS